MKCPVCYNEDTKVLDSRVAADGLAIRRRRECSKCNFRFSTYEEVELLDKYENAEKFGEGKISYAFRITYRSLERTLTSAEIDKIHKNIEDITTKVFGGVIR